MPDTVSFYGWLMANGRDKERKKKPKNQMFISLPEMFSPDVNTEIQCEKIKVSQEKHYFYVLIKLLFELLLLIQNVVHINDHLLRTRDKTRQITCIWKHNKVFLTGLQTLCIKKPVKTSGRS